MDFWDRVKEEIKKQNTTQSWLANHIDVRVDTFSRWVQRSIMPNADQAAAIAAALNTTVEYLLTGNTPENRYSSQELAEIAGMLDIIEDKETLIEIRGILKNYLLAKEGNVDQYFSSGVTDATYRHVGEKKLDNSAESGKK